MESGKKHRFLTVIIALVWLVNGLFCKILNLVPRHREIVARILGEDYSASITTTIGILELLMAFWIISRYKSRLNVIFQMAIIATMNLLEFVLAPDLLLWGKANILFAFCFIGLIYYSEFIVPKTNG
ncbi:DoxX-like family protein [Flavobacterium silvaticum]|uniref:DoxX family protein n=1 Tax=Flavobacterium silvaticum TaxID=1852020 RepID=A0A972FLM1_9FLAO|nr:DoxX-like family protein [Flavobacterium silvaticum]NMH28314.1 hypothetical protein [Flavobacterium silvaticum]